MTHLSIHQWQRRFWVKKGNNRYYTAEITQDLFGSWILVRSWGSAKSCHGQWKQQLCGSYDEAQRQLEQTARRRSQRGYQHLQVLAEGPAKVVCHPDRRLS